MNMGDGGEAVSSVVKQMQLRGSAKMPLCLSRMKALSPRIPKLTHRLYTFYHLSIAHHMIWRIIFVELLGHRTQIPT